MFWRKFKDLKSDLHNLDNLEAKMNFSTFRCRGCELEGNEKRSPHEYKTVLICWGSRPVWESEGYKERRNGFFVSNEKYTYL